MAEATFGVGSLVSSMGTEVWTMMISLVGESGGGPGFLGLLGAGVLRGDGVGLQELAGVTGLLTSASLSPVDDGGVSEG